MDGTIHRQPAGKWSEAGFSLTELITSLSVLSLLIAAFGATWLTGADDRSLHAAVREVTSVMRLARMKATATGAEHRVAFDIGTDSYRIERGDKMFKSDIWYPITNWTPVSEKVDMYNVTAFKDDKVTFNVNGTVEGVNGAVYLKNAKDHKVRARVMSATGNIQIQKEKEW
mgnify:CR=1 FL=1